MKRTALTVMLLLPLLTQAQAAEAEGIMGFPAMGWYIGTLIFAALIIGWAFYTMWKLVRYLDGELKTTRAKLDGTWVEPEPEPEPVEIMKPKRKPRFVLQRSVPISDEAAITFDHDYDGIRELDNDLPPWWKALFYITAILGVVYFLHYEVFKTGPSMFDRYDKSVALAEETRQARMSGADAGLTAANVTALADENSLLAGQEIYMTNCMICHGAEGQGLAGAGPNLTDPYWIHGGHVSDLFMTIRYGIPVKGMQAWKDQLLPKQIQQVSSYILALQGTDPEGGLAPQGDLYEPEAETPAEEGGEPVEEDGGGEDGSTASL